MKSVVHNRVDPDVRPKLKIQAFKIPSLISIEPNTAELWIGLLNALKSLPSLRQSSLSHLLKFAE